ncbi:hypothetical protein K501DRAFT_236953 [Backusella circina FSU 941]|nr:hypothetical protein K501DRAFT_236953 [Backusella circina FSU 941]
MDEDEEICRVCRCEATPDQPLFYPCKCSGSIRHVHQKCLQNWLAHSKKKYCELCNYTFKFSPVYKTDMPEKLPLKLFFRYFVNLIKNSTTLGLRAVLVGFVWLGVVPFITIGIWRLHIMFADSIIWLVKRFCISSPSPLDTESMTKNIDIKRVWNMESVLSDCLKGWIIAFVVVLFFIVAILLKEWIQQNVPIDLDDVAMHIEDHDDEEEEEEEVPPLVPAGIPPELQEFQTRLVRNRPMRARTDHGRPRLRNDPSDYENLEAMWQVDDPRDPAFVAPDAERYTRLYDQSEEMYGFRDQMDGIGNMGQDQFQPEMLFNNNELTGVNNGMEGGSYHRPIVLDDDDDDEEEEEEEDHEDEEEDDDDDDDDFMETDGILEAIGMRGKLIVLFQNSCLMILLISLCIGVSVCFPLITGSIFLILRPWESVFYAFDTTKGFLYSITDLSKDRFDYAVTQFDKLDLNLAWAPNFAQPILYSAKSIGQSLFSFLFSIDTTAPISSDAWTNIITDSSAMSHSVSLWKSVVYEWNQLVPLLGSWIKGCEKMAYERGAWDRAGCICIGHILISIGIGFYLLRTRSFYAHVGRTVHKVIVQLGLFTKLSFFMFMEIGLFPLLCGFLLDAATFALFFKTGHEGQLQAVNRRIHFLNDHTVSSIFLHWIVGTGFMFVFSCLVSFCRSIVRPGVIWFIRDPESQQFNPIKELIERPVLTQLRKLVKSALIYGSVIEIGVGGSVLLVSTIFHDILPLRWYYSQPLLDLPLDMFFVMLGFPVLISYFDPQDTLRKLTKQWMVWLCHKLRLSSFLLGERFPTEEGRIVYHDWNSWFNQTRPDPTLLSSESTLGEEQQEYVSFQHDGQLARVPKHDNVRYIPGRRMIVPVDPVTLEPIDEEEKVLGHPSVEDPEHKDVDTTIVYIPPYFKQRMIVFMAIMCLSWMGLLCYLFVGPVAVGRLIFARLTAKRVHDVYSHCAGSIVMICFGVATKKIKDAAVYLSRQSVHSFHGYFNAVFKWIYNLCVLLTSFGIVIPLLCGLIFQFYIIIPLQHWGTQAPSFDMSIVWINGLAFFTLISGVAFLLPRNQFGVYLNMIINGGVAGFQANACIKTLVGPLIVQCSIAIVLPYLISFFYIIYWPIDDASEAVTVIQTIYPATVILAFLYKICVLCIKLTKSWAQYVREKYFLVDRVLHNVD